MATTAILLLKHVDGLGSEGDEVTVRAGYARNFLFPTKVAIPVTRANRKQIESLKQARERREREEMDAARSLEQKLTGLRLAFAVKSGEGGRIFGSVSVHDIHEKLLEHGADVERKKILLPAPAKTLGTHSAKIRLHPEITVELEFEVVSENVVEAES
jgi:large subunit ribosomal protein L9